MGRSAPLGIHGALTSVARESNWGRPVGRPTRALSARARLSVLASEPDCLNLVQFLVADEVRHAQFVPVVHAVEQIQETHHVDDRKQCELASHPGPPWGQVATPKSSRFN